MEVTENEGEKSNGKRFHKKLKYKNLESAKTTLDTICLLIGRHFVTRWVPFLRKKCTEKM